MTFTSFLNASFKKCHNSWSYLKCKKKKIRIQGKLLLELNSATCLRRRQDNIFSLWQNRFHFKQTENQSSFITEVSEKIVSSRMFHEN